MRPRAHARQLLTSTFGRSCLWSPVRMSCFVFSARLARMWASSTSAASSTNTICGRHTHGLWQAHTQSATGKHAPLPHQTNTQAHRHALQQHLHALACPPPPLPSPPHPFHHHPTHTFSPTDTAMPALLIPLASGSTASITLCMEATPAVVIPITCAPRSTPWLMDWYTERSRSFTASYCRISEQRSATRSLRAISLQ